MCALLTIQVNQAAPHPILDCSRKDACVDPLGKAKDKWTGRHEELFWFGIGRVIRAECEALKALGAASYVAQDSVEMVEANCANFFLRSLNMPQATRLLVSGKVKTVLEFKRLGAFRIKEGRMVSAIVYYSYTADVKSGQPSRDAFEQYEFIETDRGIEVRWVARGTS
jgi:hypothetical protein